MKTLVYFPPLFACLIFLTGCGGEADAPSADTGLTAYEIQQEIIEVQEQVRDFMLDNELEESPVVVEAEQNMLDAARAFTQARRNHPELAPLYEQAETLQDLAMQNREDGDEVAYQQHKDATQQIRMELTKMARTIPEIRELRNALLEAERQSTLAVADFLSEVNDQGKHLGDRLRELLEAKE